MPLNLSFWMTPNKKKKTILKFQDSQYCTKNITKEMKTMQRENTSESKFNKEKQVWEGKQVELKMNSVLK